LLRSATSTTIPGIKREGSDTASLKNVAKAEPGLVGDRPGLPSRSSSFTAVDDARAKKKAMVEAELQDAITALRKPNRELAGKAVVEAAERRTTGSLSSIKSMCPSRWQMAAWLLLAWRICWACRMELTGLNRREETNAPSLVAGSSGQGHTCQQQIQGRAGNGDSKEGNIARLASALCRRRLCAAVVKCIRHSLYGAPPRPSGRHREHAGSES
jgi:hypothetical protein